jgi:hypothetical protein
MNKKQSPRQSVWEAIKTAIINNRTAIGVKHIHSYENVNHNTSGVISYNILVTTNDSKIVLISVQSETKIHVNVSNIDAVYGDVDTMMERVFDIRNYDETTNEMLSRLALLKAKTIISNQIYNELYDAVDKIHRFWRKV